MNIRRRVRAILVLTLGVTATGLPLGPATGQDVANGQKLFVKCQACHSLTPGRVGIGPSLAGVIGRKSASVAGFAYSPAMQKAGLVWNAATIDRFITAPRKLVPGTKMSFVGLPAPTDRADVIAYLKSRMP